MTARIDVRGEMQLQTAVTSVSRVAVSPSQTTSPSGTTTTEPCQELPLEPLKNAKRAQKLIVVDWLSTFGMDPELAGASVDIDLPVMLNIQLHKMRLKGSRVLLDLCFFSPLH